MGISGLLPLLKDIQTNKHLSEFRGQTLAVDGYVWLHRGSYGCAPELVTGKRTTKYVEYAMHRVRLLRHHGIQPYLVFDGGPLPAKQGTESERKQRREENLSRANALAAQGKHTQAREYYVKCVDVTPQMAYQLIKALRAEGFPYVVAPYEADAQLAYLERTGVVDGIITEDSDLLVFGCKKVLFKLDTAASTVTCISRSDFASVASTSAGGLSLLGWSDAQFRTMAILSGCDYLPSIPGIGLKTAWTLLRKHKTVENMLSALRLEGKKKIPKGYLDAFRLAEKVFLHQRVYDPAQERLVHLTPPPGDEPWDAEKEAYVGAHIEPSLAKQVAQGDACPISLLPMEDINPSFAPRALKPIPMNAATPTPAGHRPDKGKGRAKHPAPPGFATAGAGARGSLHQFFSPQVREAAAGAQATPGAGHSTGSAARPAGAGSGSTGTGTVRPASAGPAPAMVVGKQSGKRTLAEVMQDDMSAKRKRRDEGAANAHSRTGAAARPTRTPTTSKFFGAQQRSVSDPRGARGVWAPAVSISTPPSGAHHASPGTGPSSLAQRGRASAHTPHPTQGKENVPFSAGAGVADGAADVLMADADADADVVAQEDGYASPAPSPAQWDSPDISSPVRPGAARWDDDDDGDADVLSSPPVHRGPRRAASSASIVVERVITRALPLVPLRAPCFGAGGQASGSGSGSGSRSKTKSHSSQSPRPGHRDDARAREAAARGPDLRDAFDDDDWADELTSAGEDWSGSECASQSQSQPQRRRAAPGSTASSTPGPATPAEADLDDENADGDDGIPAARLQARYTYERALAGDEKARGLRVLRVMGGAGARREDVTAAAAITNASTATATATGIGGVIGGGGGARLADEGSSEELEEDELELESEAEVEAAPAGGAARVAHGWWERWARGGPGASGGGHMRARATGGAGEAARGEGGGGEGGRGGGRAGSDRAREYAPLRRRETTVGTADGGGGRQRGIALRRSLPSFAPGEDLRAVGRAKLTFAPDTTVTTPKVKSKLAGAGATTVKTPATEGPRRLEQFRWTPASR